MKKIFLLFLCAALAFCLISCSPSYEEDERIGRYTDKETGAYTLVLLEGGKGSITYASSTVLPTEEEIFFEIRDGYLYVSGKSANGAVIGQNEYYGEIKEEGGTYTVALKSELTGIVFGTFTKEK